MMNATAGLDMRQYLTFLLGDETFSLNIEKVREVLDYTLIMPVPRMPEYMEGVINLRGAVVPVVDLRLKFGMPAMSVSVNTCIIIVEVVVNGEPSVLGLLADEVREVLELDGDDIMPAPRIGMRLDNGFIKGMGKQGERFIIVLDIDRVFSAGELDLAEAIGETVEAAAAAR